MEKRKREKLERAGWRVGSAAEFLGLSDSETAVVEIKLSLSRSLRARRTRKGISQMRLAALVHSSQSRVAKMEAGDPSVSVDLLLRSLFALGASSREVARAIERSHPAA
ncbi:MAG TPA: helix-turn-helix domain-containing protein [Thermoanaerobaculia bacterium]|nr:helix-turn-helix domain-containing protein [Thermoanaerobaculia bacterium]